MSWNGKFISYLKPTSFYLPLVPLWVLLPSPANSDHDGQNEKSHNASNNSNCKIEVNLGYMMIIVLWSMYHNYDDYIDAVGMVEESRQSSNNSNMKVEVDRWDLLWAILTPIHKLELFSSFKLPSSNNIGIVENWILFYTIFAAHILHINRPLQFVLSLHH